MLLKFKCQEKLVLSTYDIDLNYVDEIREQLPLLKHRRSDLYELLEK